MSMKAKDLRACDFLRRMRGYDPDEVQAFLALAADRLDQLEQEHESDTRTISELESELERYRTMDQGLRDTLLEVRTSSESALENARREADLVLREAEFKAEQFLVDGHAKRKILDEDLAQLKRQRAGFISRFRHLIESQGELLEALSQEDASETAVPAGATGSNDPKDATN
jgi:cell division initiation protein